MRSCFSGLESSWEAYLQYSRAARVCVDKGIPIQIDATLLETRGPGRWWLDLKPEWEKAEGTDARIKALQRVRIVETIRIGFHEFGTDRPVEDSARDLSDLADFCLGQALLLAIQELGDRGPSSSNTLAILGMGKLGGRELNFSSDIDIVFVFAETPKTPHGFANQEAYGRVAQKIVKHLSARDLLGELYRVDLRLRPEGDGGPLTRSIGSYENYYAAYGEMWERLALLKARRSAGCEETGYEFDRMIQGFCYARNMTPAALAEIAKLKERAEEEIVGRPNWDRHVKLGPGGIRDIEFFAQAHQLLHGARQTLLRNRNTLETIRALRQLGFISNEESDTLCGAYRFWRKLEHRLQIIDHRQTHTLPAPGPELDMVAESLDKPSGQSLWDEQLNWRRRVRALYDDFFNPLRKNQTPEAFPNWRYFADPDQARRTWESLKQMPGGFHAGGRTRIAFERFASIIAGSLERLSRPDVALTQFVRFVEAYGARSLLFESLSANPLALDLLLRLFDLSRYLGQTLAAHPASFEEIARGDLDELRSVDALLREFAKQSAANGRFARLRLFKREQLIRLAMRHLLKLAPLEKLQAEFTHVADACLHVVWQELGTPEIAVMGLGKHGGREMGFGSDLDIIVVGDPSCEEKAKALARTMSEATPEGMLFPVDLRLRPFGEGRIVHSVEEYENYYNANAQTWEIQALGKARFASGHEAVAARFLDAIRPIWRNRSETPELKAHLLAMRERVEKERGRSGDDRLEFKTGVGGIVDVEFTLSYWQMRRGHWQTNAYAALEAFSGEMREMGTVLERGYRMLRLTEFCLRMDENQSLSHLPQESGKRLHLARYCGFDSDESFMEALSHTRKEIRETFHRAFDLL